MSVNFDRQAARDRHAATTPGPWMAFHDHVMQITYDSAGNPMMETDVANASEDDAEFIATAHQDLILALDQLDEKDALINEQSAQLADNAVRINDLEDRVAELLRALDRAA